MDIDKDQGPTEPVYNIGKINLRDVPNGDPDLPDPLDIDRNQRLLDFRQNRVPQI